MNISERVSTYLSVKQVAQMAGCALPTVREAADRGEIKVLNKKGKNQQRFRRKLDPQSVYSWLEEQNADYVKNPAPKLKIRGCRNDTNQLNRIEQKLDELLRALLEEE